MKQIYRNEPRQLSASVILTGGLTIYKEDIIQHNLSQGLSFSKDLGWGRSFLGLAYQLCCPANQGIDECVTIFKWTVTNAWS